MNFIKPDEIVRFLHETMEKLLDVVIYNGYTVRDALVVAGVVIGAWIVFKILRRIFGKKQGGRHVQSAKCPNCGWQGIVSRWAGFCPQCNLPLGDRKAKR